MSSTSNKRRNQVHQMPMHLKYPKYDKRPAEPLPSRLTPSQRLEELNNGPKQPAKYPPPRIIELHNIEDHSVQKTTSVGIDEPIFQPFPQEIIFSNYEPYGEYEQTLYLRNNDTHARRVKIQTPDSEYFSISAPKLSAGRQDGRIAAGMEVAYTIKFRPKERQEYKLDLVVCTEREKFIVPLQAPGPMAVLLMPDELDFGLSAVKADTSKSLLLRNGGNKSSHFQFQSLHPFFSVNPLTAYLDVGSAMQLEVIFHPLDLKRHLGELLIVDDDRKETTIRLLGQGENLPIYLENAVIELDPVFISLPVKTTFKIFNNSDRALKFEWKSYSAYLEEAEEKRRVLEDLARLQELEIQNAQSADWTDTDENSLIDEMGMIHRKYKNLRRAAEEDSMFFTDECFTLEPVRGEIWPNSYVTATITFRPKLAVQYRSFAYLDVMGRDERLSLQLSGTGIGPKVTASYEVLDIGDIFISSTHGYEITLQNDGDIEANWRILETATTFGSKFQFRPNSGVLPIGGSQNVNVYFHSNILGEFNERFEVQLGGTEKLVTFRYKGHVVGPTFNFDVTEIAFSVVSFDFLTSRELTLYNTSEISMTYNLRIPQDGKYTRKEFDVVPATGTLGPKSRQRIRLDFVSTTVKMYQYFLVVDVKQVGDALLSIPITAECLVPQVRLQQVEVLFGECFLRYKYRKSVTLINESNFWAKFEALPQDESTQVVASYQLHPDKGTLAPRASVTLDVDLICEKLGNMRLPLYFRIAGSTDLPLSATLCCTGSGPRVVADSTNITWGNAKCLVDHAKVLKLTNESLISASFRAFLKNQKTRFKLLIKDGVILPGESLDLGIVANLDDTIAFSDQLHIAVTEGPVIIISLSAKGTGTTLVSLTDLNKIDFGHQLTNRHFETQFTLENRGRRSQVISWANRTLSFSRQAAAVDTKKKDKPSVQPDKSGAKGKDNKAITQKKKQPGAENEISRSEGTSEAIERHTHVFSVVPEGIELKPMTACTFTLKGSSSRAGEITETLVCETRVPQEKTSRPAFSPEVKVHLLNPLVTPSKSKLEYQYIYTPDNPPSIQTQPLVLTNSSQLPLSFLIRSQTPFNVDQTDASLVPGQSITVNVDFDPSFKDDKLSRRVDNKLSIIYDNHPQRDSIDLAADICFPNLEFEYTKIDFGCLLNDTTKSMVVKVKNTSRVDAVCRWAFIEDDDETKTHVSTVKNPHIPINQVFDILPIRCRIKPAASQDMIFVYYGHANRKFRGLVACEVEGGPDYELTLVGEASSSSYKLDKNFIDFGHLLYDKKEERDFYITNSSKVSFAFKVRLDKLSRPGILSVSPLTGKVFAGERQRISVKLTPGVPGRILEYLSLDIAHFPALDFPISAVSTFATATLSLPRIYDTLPLSSLDLLLPAALGDPTAVTPDRPNGQDRTPEGQSDLPVASSSIASPLRKGVRANGYDIYEKLQTVALETLKRQALDVFPPERLTGAEVQTARTNTRTSVPATSSPSKRSNSLLSSSVAFREPQSSEVEAEVSRLIFSSFLLDKLRNPPSAAGQANPQEEGTEINSPKRLEKFSKGTSKFKQKLKDKAAAGAVSPSNNQEVDGEKHHAPGEGTNIELQGIDSERVGKGEDQAKDDLVKGTAAGGQTRRVLPQDEFAALASNFTVAHFLCDFSNVVLGSRKTKKFRLTNIGKAPISFDIDKNLCIASGFHLEPEKVIKLPETESIEFVSAFSASKNRSLGPISVDLPLRLKNGPTILLRLVANVCVPELSLSSDTVDFGKVLAGRSRVTTIRFENKSPVNVEWSFKKPIGSSRDAPFFCIQQTQGVVPSGSTLDVTTEFLPTEGRTYSLKLPIKIVDNPKPIVLSLRGESSCSKVVFDPPALELGPVLPFGLASRKTFHIKNESDHPVEIISLDFDKEFLKDEEILREATGYDEEGLLRVVPRPCGGGLPACVLEEHQYKVSQKNRDGNVTEGLPPYNTLSLRAKGKAVDLLIFGPPFSGVSSLCSEVSKKTNLPHVGIDIWINAAIDAVVRSVQPKAATLPAPPSVGVEGDPEASSGANNENRADALLASQPELDSENAETLQEVVSRPPAFTSALVERLRIFSERQKELQAKSEFFHRYASGVSAIVPGTDNQHTPSAVQTNAGKAGGAQKSSIVLDPAKRSVIGTASGGNASETGELLLNSDLLAEILSWSLKNTLYEDGIIIDGIQSRYASLGTVLSTLQRVIPEVKYFYVNIRADLYASRLAKVEVTENLKVADDTGPKENSLVPSATPVNPKTGPPEEMPVTREAVSKTDPRVSPVIDSISALKLAGLESVLSGCQAGMQAVAAILSKDGPKAPTTAGLEPTSKETPVAPSMIVPVSKGTIGESRPDASSSNQHAVESNPGGCAQAAEVKPVIVLSVSGLDCEQTLLTDLLGAVGALPDKVATAVLGGRLPLPKDYEIIRRPTLRPQRPGIKLFQLLNSEDVAKMNETQAQSQSQQQEGSGKARRPSMGGQSSSGQARRPSLSKGANAAAAAVFDPTVPPVPPVGQISKTRWVLKPNESVTLTVQFAGTQVGKNNCILGFEIRGAPLRTADFFCWGTCAVPTINADPRNVFMHRVKSRTSHTFVQKKYVTNLNTFEFGPLLVGKSPFAAGLSPAELDVLATDALSNPAWKGYREPVRISNNGLFPIQAFFAFESSSANGPSVSPFFVTPSSLAIPEGETREVFLWAFPTEEKVHQDGLVCCIKDNPDPVIFPISCLGARPMIELSGPWNENLGNAGVEGLAGGPQALAPGNATPSKGQQPRRATAESEKVNATVATSVVVPSAPRIDFDRLLIGRQEEKHFTVKNSCPLPVAWAVKLSELANYQELRVAPPSGILKPHQDVKIVVNFNAMEERTLSVPLNVEFSDVEGELPQNTPSSSPGTSAPSAEKASPANNSALSRIQRQQVTIQAEAYKIDVCSFEDSEGQPMDGTFDFGTKRVFEQEKRDYNMRNRGKYSIKFRYYFRKSSTQSLFTISPAEGVIEPNKTLPITVTFNSTKEVFLKDNKDIRCSIMEATTEDLHSEFNLVASARSVFSRFRIQPSRGIAFGAMSYKEPPRDKRLEIKNEGEFEFTFTLFNGSKTSVEEAKAAVLANLGEPDGTDLKIGQFHVTPDSGVLAPGATAIVEIRFQPHLENVYRENVLIEISGRDHSDPAQNASLLYELLGESSYPGINTTDFESIFEEQGVVRAVDTEIKQQNVFAEQERVFLFGPVVPSSHPQGVQQKFKITNPTKVRAVVKFDIESLGKGEKSADAFSVQPASVDIPPHEYRYISVYFKPTLMKQFGGLFVASVEDGADPQTSKLEFELSGEGTLPCITVERPSRRDKDGAIILDFDRVRVGKTKKLPVIIRNDGLVPATVMFSMPSNQPDFNLSCGKSGSIKLDPKHSETFYVVYSPRNNEPSESSGAPTDSATSLTDQCDMKLSVLHNPYEESFLRISGKPYKDIVAFEDLPSETDDEIDFGDMNISSTIQVTNGVERALTIRNHGSDTVRFEWAKQADFSFSPSVGHLQPGQAKQILIKFKIAAPEGTLDESKAADSGNTVRYYKQHNLVLTYRRIQYPPEDSTSFNNNIDWDNSMMIIAYGAASGTSETTASALPVGDPSGTHLEETNTRSNSSIPEPRFTPAVGEPLTATLRVNAVADTPRFESGTKEILFRQTAMFQNRAHKFTVKNSSKLKLPYNWTFVYNGTAMSPPPCPFTIQPITGSVEGEDAATFDVMFCPTEVDDFSYVLKANIEGLTSSIDDLAIKVVGQAYRPVCHFGVEPSDYAHKRSLDLPGPQGELGPLDPSVHVVEIESLGTKVKNTKRFYVVNTMNSGYEFQWEALGETNASFRCTSERGLIMAGKRYEMVFEFTPEDIKLQESFWMFRIPQFNIAETVLFVGQVVEPRVSFNKTFLNFGALLLGSSPAVETVSLVNHEHIPFSYTIDRRSLDYEDDSTPVLDISPMSGVVPPDGSASLEVKFSPSEEKAHNFNVVCLIRRKPVRLTLNVKGEGYAIHDHITVQDAAALSSSQVSIIQLNTVNTVDFGSVKVNEKKAKQITLHNSGKFNFDFNWSKLKLPPVLSIQPESGSVRKGDKVVCTLTYNPVTDDHLEDVRLVCTTAGARQYTVSVTGHGVKPAVSFSFTRHDFGPCFITSPGVALQVEQIVLRVTNNDLEHDISFDCLFEKRPYLEVKCEPCLLRPGQVYDVPFLFSPREIKQYQEKVPFLVNGNTTVNLAVIGEGVPAKVELANISQQNIDFGVLQVHGEANRALKLVNRSKRAAAITLVDPLSSAPNSLAEQCVSYQPKYPTTLKQGESLNVELRFSPNRRILPFKQELQYIVAGVTRRLLVVSGACQGMDIQLESDALPFGPVCLGSQLTRRLQMENKGDLVGKFKWDESAFRPDFTITPIDGVILPQKDVRFEVTFKPTQINSDVCVEKVRCTIDGASTLFLTLTGACVPQPASAIKELRFKAKARGEEKQKVAVQNTSDQPWNLLPVVTGEHWRTSETVHVPAKGKTDVEIIYHPLSMTIPKLPLGSATEHQGSLFFALPDGTALLYQLFGSAAEPDPSGTIKLSTPAKKYLPVTVAVENWLKVPQRFEVKVELNTTDQAAKLEGAQAIDVPALNTKDYNMKFYAYKHGAVTAVVRFTNSQTGEYLYFNLAIDVKEPTDIDTIELEAPVRQLCRKVISIANPLPPSTEITLPDDWCTCANPNVRVKPIGALTGSPEGSFEVEYRPLIPTTQPVMEKLRISIAELGVYPYKLQLTAPAAGAERSLFFRAHLGESQSQTYRFRAYGSGNLQFQCSVGQPDFFQVDPTVSVVSPDLWEGAEGTISVRYEPTGLGDVRDTLTINHPTAGRYVIALQGNCDPPLPQGPFSVPPGGQCSLAFKNIFSKSEDFFFAVDNKLFTVGASSMKIEPKGTKQIVVKFASPSKSSDAAGGNATPGSVSTSGKLMISCRSAPDMPPWIYYLKGDV